MFAFNSLRILPLALLALIVLARSFAAEPHAAYSIESDALLSDLAQANDESVGSQWQIILDAGVVTVTPGSILYLPMPDGSQLNAQITSVKKAPNGDLSVIGDIDGSGMLVLTLGKYATFGSIETQNQRYSIYQSSPDRLILSNLVANSKFNLKNDYLLPPADANTPPSRPKTAQNQLRTAEQASMEVSIIDFLVVYSPEFAAVFMNSPVTRINQLITFTNQALARSGVLMEFRLVEARQLNFDNSASVETTLNAATDGSGSFSSLPQLRNQFGADMVAVLHGNTNNSAFGLAWVNGNSADFAFSSTNISVACCDSVFAHEIGHNLGSGHEHAAVNPSAPSPCDSPFRDYACGHGNPTSGWGTIMSRLNDQAAGFRFSNLNSDCLGEPCGIPAGQPNPADNRRAFNESRILIENFRASPSSPPSTPSTSGFLAAIVSLLLG